MRLHSNEALHALGQRVYQLLDPVWRAFFMKTRFVCMLGPQDTIAGPHDLLALRHFNLDYRIITGFIYCTAEAPRTVVERNKGDCVSKRYRSATGHSALGAV